jgi:hypothetical protein
MTTLDFTSTSADGLRHADDPLISVSTILANLGTHPVVTFPLITGETADVDWAWDYLEEPAGFFGITMPPRDELRSACERFEASASVGTDHALLAVTIMLIEANGRAQFVISGAQARCFDPTPVRIAVSSDVPWPAPSAADPQWRRMAALTTSRGDVDQLRRWLNGSGFVDLVHRREESSIGSPALGALVFDHAGGLTGLDNPYPVSVLGLMERCGAVRAGMSTGQTEFAGFEVASFAWWISPFFEAHPVEQIGDVRYEVESGLPPTFLGRRS